MVGEQEGDFGRALAVGTLSPLPVVEIRVAIIADDAVVEVVCINMLADLCWKGAEGICFRAAVAGM